MSLPNVNFATNKFSIKERWWKLYRSIYNKFLKKDFVHVNDFKTMLEKINVRLQTIESNMAAGDAAVMSAVTTTTSALQATMGSHFHLAPQAPAGAIPTLPPAIVPLPPSPPAPAPTTPKITYTEVGLQSRDTQLQGMGPATAPLGDGSSTEAIVATTTAKSDIGI